MTPRQRFGVWVAAVTVALAAPLWLHADIARAPFVAAVCGLAGLSVFLLLLATTPVDAIRLPRWASAVAIALGSLVLALIAGAPAPMAAGLGLLGALMSLLAGVRAFRREPHSPWIYTLMLWHPAFWLMPTARHSFPAALDWFWVALLAVGLCVATMIRSSGRGRLAAAPTVVLGISWQVAGAAALWIAWHAGS